MTTFPCTACGRYAFPAPRVCYWCAHPLTDERRGALIADGVLAMQVRHRAPLEQYRRDRDAKRAARQ